jgi:NAD(P)-dependent dehydrogenase (short-subunit alcohol dehydrogenase family)
MRDVLSIVPKTAVWSIVQGLSKEEGRYGVRANAVGVGVTDVGMGEREMQHSGESMQDFFERILKQIPLRRIGHADQIAETVAFMASQRASYVTGQLINVDGGLAG